jgi:dihydroxy-acid dehydratase
MLRGDVHGQHHGERGRDARRAPRPSIGFVHGGDEIQIDVTTDSINLTVDLGELGWRAFQIKPFVPRYTTGLLEKFARLVQGAEKGAVTSA